MILFELESKHQNTATQIAAIKDKKLVIITIMNY